MNVIDPSRGPVDSAAGRCRAARAGGPGLRAATLLAGAGLALVPASALAVDDYSIVPGVQDLGGGLGASTAYRVHQSHGGVGGITGSSSPDVLFRHGFEGELDAPTAVVARHVFYDQSGWDRTDDNAAIATDKVALLPGQKAGFANYTSYSLGLNGIMVDIAGLPGPGDPTAADFSFKVGSNSSVNSWAAGPAPSDVRIFRGIGVDGSDRIALYWGADSAKKKWLRIRVEPTSATGLDSADDFYFGNAIGDAGNRAGLDAIVNATDEILARANPRSAFVPAPIDFLYDYNRDRQVNATDQIIARANTTSAFTALQLIAPALGAASASALAGPETDGPGTPVVSLRVARTENGGVRVESDGPLPPGVMLEMSTQPGSGAGFWEVVAAGAATGPDGGSVWVVGPRPTFQAMFFRAVRPW